LIQIKFGRRPQASVATMRPFTRSTPMMDAVMMAIGFACFALSIGYVYACDRL
jgi:hypothetical protein